METLVDIKSTLYSPVKEIEQELLFWKKRDKGDDQGIKDVVALLEQMKKDKKNDSSANESQQ